MIYVLESRQTSVKYGYRGIAPHVVTRVTARVSTRPYDYRAPRRSFTLAAWEAFCQRRDVLHRHSDGVYRRQQQ